MLAPLEAAGRGLPKEAPSPPVAEAGQGRGRLTAASRNTGRTAEKGLRPSSLKLE